MVRLAPAAVAAAVFSPILALAGAAQANASSAITLTVGATLATSCSQAAVANVASATSLETCSRALQEEALSRRDRAATHVNRGVLHMLRRDYGSALADFDAAVRMNAGLGEALVDRGIAKVALGRVAEGLSDLDRGLAMGLSTPEYAYFHRAAAREELNDPRGAYLDYRKAAELKPDWARPREELARFRVVRSR